MNGCDEFQCSYFPLIRVFCSKGEFNCLVATCIAEEGLDIGDVDLIVSYDMLSSPVRMVQRMGRTGRKRAGRVVMLVTEGVEESKLKASNQKTKRVAKLLQQPGKFELYSDLSPRMVPSELEPVMVSTLQSVLF
jgi:ERCC4-related helicase